LRIFFKENNLMTTSAEYPSEKSPDASGTNYCDLHHVSLQNARLLDWFIEKQGKAKFNTRIVFFGWNVHIWYVYKKIRSSRFALLTGCFLIPPKR